MVLTEDTSIVPGLISHAKSMIFKGNCQRIFCCREQCKGEWNGGGSYDKGCALNMWNDILTERHGRENGSRGTLESVCRNWQGNGLLRISEVHGECVRSVRRRKQKG